MIVYNPDPPPASGDVVRGYVNYRCQCGARLVFWQGQAQYQRGCHRPGRPGRRWRGPARPHDRTYGR